MKRIVMMFAAAAALCGFAADRKVAVFVQNKSNVPSLSGQTESIRERIVGAFSEVDGFQIVDSTLALEAFKDAPSIAKELGCDYVAVATIISATATRRNMNGRANTVFALRMAFKVTDAGGVSVDGMPTWSQKFPVLDADGDATEYYEQLLDRWESDMTVAVATKAPKWRAPAAAAAEVPFFVSTTVDSPVAAYESQTKGVSGEQLQELRKVVGGATIMLDGVQVGTAPCEIKTAPGLHKLRVTRQWMKPYEATVKVAAGTKLEIALELNDEGVAKWGTIEVARAGVAQAYAEAAAQRGVKINIDTTNWRDVGAAESQRTMINNVNQK